VTNILLLPTVSFAVNSSQEGDLYAPIAFMNASNAPIDLTGITFEIKLRPSLVTGQPDPLTVVLDGSSANGGQYVTNSGSSGIVVIYVPQSTMENIEPGTYYLDLIAAGDNYDLVLGEAQVAHAALGSSGVTGFNSTARNTSTADTVGYIPGPAWNQWKGNWSSTVSYIPNDVVFYGVSSWVALQVSENQAPANGSYWSLMAQGLDPTALNNAVTQAQTAATSASASATSATGSAGSAASSSTAAAGSATNAATSASSALSSLTSFRTYWLGSASTDPTTDGNSAPLKAGAEYFNTTSKKIRVYDGSAWGDYDATAQAAASAAAASEASAATHETNAAASASAAAASAAAAANTAANFNGVGSLNGKSGALTLAANNGLLLSTSGQTLIVSGYGQMANPFRNPGCNIAQRGGSLSGVTFGYTLDSWVVGATGAGVGVSQGVSLGSATSLTVTGATGNTAVSVIRRVEELDALPFNSSQVMLVFKVLNNSGAAITPNVGIYHCATTNNFSTVVGTPDVSVNAQPCPNGATTQCAVSFQMPSTAWQGFQLNVNFGALNANTKAVSISEIDMFVAPSTVAIGLITSPPPARLPRYVDDLLACKTYYQQVSCAWTIYAGDGNVYTMNKDFHPMRATPTASYTVVSQTNNQTGWPNVSVSGASSLLVNMAPLSSTGEIISANLNITLTAEP
jgi:hypothetical protein